MFIDTHCHPHLAKEKNTDDILSNFEKSGWAFLVSIGTDYKTSIQCIELSQKYDFVIASIGIHPCDIEFNAKTISHYATIWEMSDLICKIEELYTKNKKHVVAIWECWLDYHWIESISESSWAAIEEIKKLQKSYFKSQIYLAKKLRLPFIIHNRSAKSGTLDIIKECWYKNFILHCFSEDYDFAKSCLDYAPKAYISFSGIATFNSAKSVQETVQKIPLDNILVETDSPYLTPTPHRGKEENEPMYVKHVIDKICELREENDELIIQALLTNSKKVFHLQ